MTESQDTNITKKKQSSESEGTKADGLGLIQLRVAIVQLRKEGRAVRVHNQDGALVVIIPGLELTASADGKNRIEWTKTEGG